MEDNVVKKIGLRKKNQLLTQRIVNIKGKKEL